MTTVVRRKWEGVSLPDGLVDEAVFERLVLVLVQRRCRLLPDAADAPAMLDGLVVFV